MLRTDGARAFVERLRRQGHAAEVLDIRCDDLGTGHLAVLADAVLHHLSRADFSLFLSRARRCVRTGGVLGFTVKEGDGAGWSQAKIGRPRYFTYWRGAAVGEALSAAGWDIHSIERIAGQSEPWLFVLAVAGHASSDADHVVRCAPPATGR